MAAGQAIFGNKFLFALIIQQAQTVCTTISENKILQSSLNSLTFVAHRSLKCTYDQNLDFKIRRDEQKKFLWPRLGVGRR